MIPKLKATILQIVETIWGMCFAGAGLLSRPEVAWWSSPGGQRILVLAPHPDDEVIGCGGTILKHKQNGDCVWIIYVTDGRGSRATGLGPDVMAKQRKREAEASAQALGCNRAIWLNLPENDWEPAQLQPELETILIDFSPHVVYAPSSVDFHPEHHKVAYTLANQFIQSIDDLISVRIYQIHVPLTPILVNLISPIATVLAQNRVAIEAYVTQQESVAKGLRMQHYAARYYAESERVESFWDITPQTYSLLFNQPLPWPTNIYRGLYPRSFTDPLVFCCGATVRRHLADTANQ